ncbi:MAG TPA: urease accessory protein UreD [Xanthobacteraceae bacterium]|nr:urease accessory protein UreD [Xanthobacteraceae bacterium]
MKTRAANQALAIDRDETLIANRARGRIDLIVSAADGRTRRRRVAEDGSLRVRFPRTVGGELEAVIVNTAGGIAGGDRHEVSVSARDNANLVVTTAAAEKIYRSIGPDASIEVTLDVGAGGRLAWLPQEAIVFDRGRLSRRIDVDISGDGMVTVAEMAVFGRSAMGELVEQGSFVDRWRVRRDRRLVFAETVRLDGAVAQKLAEPGVAAGGAAIATVLVCPGDETLAANVRALAGSFAGEVGISAWNGIAVARLCGKDGASVRSDLTAVLTALGAPLPRLWLN